MFPTQKGGVVARRVPTVRQDTLLVEREGRGEAIVVGTPNWFAWLTDATAFTFVDAEGHFTARKERPSHGRGGWYWKAYRRREGWLHRVYLGASAGLTLERLRQAAAALAQREGPSGISRPHTPHGRASGPADRPAPLVAAPGIAGSASGARDNGRSGQSEPDFPAARPAGHGRRLGARDERAEEASVALPALRLRLLGGFGLVCGDDPVVAHTPVRMHSLLAYLALHREAPQPRQHLAFLFWPDATEAQARNNLRQLVHQLRHAWPAADRYLATRAGTLSWRREVAVQLDVAEFEGAVALADDADRQADVATTRAALEQAARLYRGELLPGCYDDWIVPERERLGQRYRRALDRLTALLEEQREYGAAIEHAEQRLRQDPLDESAYRRLMRLHALSHNRAGALRVYHACATVLERELAVEPSAATREVYERLVRLEVPGVAAAAPVLDAALPLVGRRSQWMQVQAAWRRAVGGEAHLLLLGGEPGIGKTRLAEELLTWAAQQGLSTARTRAYAAEGRLSYGPVADWLRSAALRHALGRLDAVWLGEVARLLPELLSERPDLPHAAPLSEHWQRQRLFQALARAVLAADQPLLLLLDDLQWCDQDTLEWLHYLLRFDHRARLLVVGTARLDEVGGQHPLATLLTDLRGARLVTEIALEPLDAAETAQLGGHVAGRALDRDEARHLYRETEGNPLFVVETARAGLAAVAGPAAEGRPSAVEQRSAPAARPPAPDLHRLPPTVHAVIAARLAKLSEPARELAGLAATIGRAFTLEVLAHAHDGDENGLIRGLDELWRRRLVRDHGTSAYDFAHDKIREVAYAEATATRRRFLHRRVAQALEHVCAPELDPVSAQVAAHYEHAGLPDQAVAYYQRAAAVAQRVYANQEAIDLLKKGLVLLESLPTSQERDARELPLQTALGVSLVAIRGYGAADVMAAYGRARELGRRLGQPPSPPVLRALAIASITHTEFRQAHDLGDHLLSLAQRDRDPVLLVEARYVLSMSLFWTGAFAPARSQLEQALASYRAAQSPAHVALYTQDPRVVCLIRLAVDLWLLGYSEQAAQRREESLTLARELSHPFSLGYALAWDALLQNHRQDARATREQAEATIAMSREHRLDLWLSMGTVLRGWALAEQGDTEAGIALMREGMAAFRATGSIYKLPYFLGLLAEQYGKLGNVERGLTLLAEALAAVERTAERWCEAELYRRKGALLLIRGDDSEAEVALRRAIGVARYQRAKSIELRSVTRLAELWQRQGKRREARRMLEEIRRGVPEGLDTPDLTEARSLLAQF